MAKIYTIVISFLLLWFAPLSADAATLSFSQTSDSYVVGSTFAIGVYVGSPDMAMNAASGVVSFPWDKLEVVSISKTGSIISLWAQEPSFSNSAGTVNFEGIVMNPGFIGASGKIISITFRAKAVGQANLSFSTGSVLANDGSGTNILTGLRVAVVNIREKPVPVAPSTENIPEDNAPMIVSTTHPDQAAWYADNNPEFSWNLPSDAREVRTLINGILKSAPNAREAELISRKKISGLSDGKYYFHLQIRTAAGWSGVAHYGVNIDMTPPKNFSITFPHGASSFEPQPVIIFNTEDAMSGISHYDVKVGKNDIGRISSTNLNPYPLPPQPPGTYKVTVIAIDKAGNSASALANYTIEKIEEPIIISYPKEILFNDLVNIRGITYQNSDISVSIRQGEMLISQENSRSNTLGDFSIIVTKRLEPGIYTFTVSVTDSRGAKSNETEAYTIVVKSQFLLSVGTFFFDYASAIIILFIVLACLIGAWLFISRRNSKKVRHLRREGYEAERALEKSFNRLRNDIDAHIALLKVLRSKRKLTKEEVLFLEEFKKGLTKAEDVIAKEIQDISADSDK